MKLAGVWRVPVVFVINNNQWAISAPGAFASLLQLLLANY
jgi:2-oxoisovalerate dehydrogenase E1 component alpha subunit